jgi:hypothetical protein
VFQGSVPGVFDVLDVFPVLSGMTTKFIVPIVAKFASALFLETGGAGTVVSAAASVYPGK